MVPPLPEWLGAVRFQARLVLVIAHDAKHYSGHIIANETHKAV
jgi:hypothetical protein